MNTVPRRSAPAPQPAAEAAAEGPLRRRGRPPKQPVGDTASRDRILRAAAQLFRKQGYRGTTVRDIAEEVGILSGSLFHHFATKEEMLLEIMREAFLSVCVAHEQILAATPEPVVQFRTMLSAELEAVLSDARRDYHAVVYFDWREAPDSARTELDRYRKRHQNCWLQALRACHTQGRLRCDPEMAERIINSALRGVMNWFRKGGRYSTQEFGDMFAHLFVEDGSSARNSPERSAGCLDSQPSFYKEP